MTKAPQPPPHWEGIFKATEELYQCPQYTPIGVVGTEDCLKINVYVPATAQKPLAVMVYIHGGGFLVGNGGQLIYTPDFFMQKDVILVSFNYRLGTLGFLCLHLEEAPGNAGLKDQIAALRWVKKNIRAFGGDPDNVTIFGHSAGGTSVGLLVASEITEGLFNRAILQSGSSLANWAMNRDPISVASTMAKHLGHHTKDPKELYDLFNNMPYKKLVTATAHIPLVRQFNQHLLYLPCVEKEYDGVESFFTNIPYNLLMKNPKNISLMFGFTDREGLFCISEDTDESLELDNKRNLFSDDLVFKSKEEETAVAKKLKQYYFGNKDISRKTIMNLAEYYSDYFFEMPILLEAELMAQHIDAPIYVYSFKYSGGRNMMKHICGFKDEPGACHGDDMMYMFKSNLWPFKISKEDQKIITWMTTMTTNFAKYGDPTPDQMNVLSVKWLPIDKEDLKVLYINEELKMGQIPKPQAFQFWKNLYSKYRKL